MIECSFGQLVGCLKCPFSGKCYEEEQLNPGDKLANEFIRTLHEAYRPPTSDELFRKALMVEGE